MTGGSDARIAAIAAAAERRGVAEATARIAAALPDVTVEADGNRIVLSGRGLARRLARDPVLRWPGGLWR